MKLLINYTALPEGVKLFLSEDAADLLELFAANYHTLAKEEAFNKMSEEDQIKAIFKEGEIRIKEYHRVIFMIDFYNLCMGNQGNFNMKDTNFVLLFNEGDNCYSQIHFLEVEENNFTFRFAKHSYTFSKDKTSEILRDKIVVHSMGNRNLSLF